MVRLKLSQQNFKNQNIYLNKLVDSLHIAIEGIPLDSLNVIVTKIPKTTNTVIDMVKTQIDILKKQNAIISSVNHNNTHSKPHAGSYLINPPAGTTLIRSSMLKDDISLPNNSHNIGKNSSQVVENPYPKDNSEYDAAIDEMIEYSKKTGFKIVIGESDGTAKFNSDKEASVMKDNKNLGDSIYKNILQEKCVFEALLSEEHQIICDIIQISIKDKSELRGALRIGTNSSMPLGVIMLSKEI